MSLHAYTPLASTHKRIMNKALHMPTGVHLWTGHRTQVPSKIKLKEPMLIINEQSTSAKIVLHQPEVSQLPYMYIPTELFREHGEITKVQAAYRVDSHGSGSDPEIRQLKWRG